MIAPKLLVHIYPFFPETNVLVPLNSVADKSHTPTSKFIEIEIERVISFSCDVATVSP
jgi:hypothetical protein